MDTICSSGGAQLTDAQKRLRELRDRQSKERGKMAELSRVDALTDEQRAELDTIEKGVPDLERQIRAAMIAAEEEERAAETKETESPDAEMRERVELRGKAMLTNYILAAARGRMVDGAEAELCAAAGVQGIPLELWDIPAPTEQRDITPAPGTVGVNLDPIRPAVFANSIASRLGIQMPRVGSGTYATATITTSQGADAKAKSAAIAATAGALTVTTATPKRISARLELTLEDIAAVGQANFESILRENLALALSDELDDQAINGNGTAPNLAGIFERLTDPSAPGAGVATFDSFVAAFAGGIDGLWSNTVKDVAIVAGVDSYREWGSGIMTVRREKTATGSAANCLHMESGRFLYDDGHTTSWQAAIGKTQGVRRVGGCAAVGAHAASHIRQEGRRTTPSYL